MSRSESSQPPSPSGRPPGPAATPRTAPSYRPDQPWTTRRLLTWTADHLASRRVDSPRLSAELLLAHVLEVPRIRLYAELDRPASPLERAAYRDLIEKAAAHHPIQYLLGRASFYSLDFEVDPRVLIPRPSTETLVQRLIEHARRTPGRSGSSILDVGTGSGCIAIAAAVNLPHALITATDASGPALDVARSNARRHGLTAEAAAPKGGSERQRRPVGAGSPAGRGAADQPPVGAAAAGRGVDRIEFLEGDLFAPVARRRFDYIGSNPPYISDAEWAQVPPNVADHEPTSALRAGPDGLDLVRRLIDQAPDHLNPSGRLLIEIAASQKDATLALAAAQPRLTNPHVIADHEGLPRVLIADRA